MKNIKSALARDRALAQWRITRRKGPLHYILLNGLLPCGLVPAGAILIAVCLFAGKGWGELRSAFLWLPIGVILLFGLLNGLIMWRLNERRFRKYTQFK